MRRRAFILLLLAACVFPSIARGQRRVPVPSTRDEMLVSTDWLAKRLSLPQVVAIYIARGASDFEAAHIPNSRPILITDLAVKRAGLTNELPPVEALVDLFARAGVSNDARVVLYDNAGGLLATRAWWTLDYLGRAGNASLLDGGLQAWVAEKRPVDQGAAAPVARAEFTPRLNPRVLVTLPVMRDYSWQATHEADPGVLIVDARPQEEYEGKETEGIPRAGHIPGAVSLFWRNLLESGDKPEILPAPELRKKWREAGAAPGKKIVIYCKSGVQATHDYFTAKYLGFDPVMYDGSFLEWSAASDTAVEKKN